MKTLLIACAGALALAAASATAQEPLPAMDTNADGAVDGAELDAFVASSFAILDVNGDGYITEAESASYMPADLYAATNANGDDGLSRQEFQDQARKDFATADKDGDGVLN